MSNICVPSTDGMSILCLVCLGKGKNKGVVGSRHAFAPGSYDDHCTTKKHSDSLAHKKAEKKKKKEFKHKTQKPMVNFFKIVKKKKGADKELMKSTAAGEDDAANASATADANDAADDANDAVVDLTTAPVE